MRECVNRSDGIVWQNDSVFERAGCCCCCIVCVRSVWCRRVRELEASRAVRTVGRGSRCGRRSVGRSGLVVGRVRDERGGPGARHVRPDGPQGGPASRHLRIRHLPSTFYIIPSTFYLPPSYFASRLSHCSLILPSSPSPFYIAPICFQAYWGSPVFIFLLYSKWLATSFSLV